MTTVALYQKNGALRRLVTKVISCQSILALADAERALFKTAQDGDHIVATSETIFHAQGGGQPSDTGSMKSEEGSRKEAIFEVKLVRKLPDDRILHHGTFSNSAGPELFMEGDSIIQEIDGSKRDYHSRLHTAGHVLGLAVKQLADSGVISNVADVGKASHAPGSAFVEFQGLIGGEHKAAIQNKCAELVEQNLPVDICFWDEETVRSKCTAIPDAISTPDGLMRVVDIVGAGAYPCGGTHVLQTGDIGAVVVRRISRQKGITKVSYEIADKA